jgi:hypothetical protein
LEWAVPYDGRCTPFGQQCGHSGQPGHPGGYSLGHHLGAACTTCTACNASCIHSSFLNAWTTCWGRTITLEHDVTLGNMLNIHKMCILEQLVQYVLLVTYCAWTSVCPSWSRKIALKQEISILLGLHRMCRLQHMLRGHTSAHIVARPSPCNTTSP